jgi:hypothetical protein
MAKSPEVEHLERAVNAVKNGLLPEKKREPEPERNEDSEQELERERARDVS